MRLHPNYYAIAPELLRDCSLITTRSHPNYYAIAPSVQVAMELVDESPPIALSNIAYAFALVGGALDAQATFLMRQLP